LPRALVVRPDEREYVAPLMACHLGDEVRRGAEAVNPEAPAVAGHA